MAQVTEAERRQPVGEDYLKKNGFLQLLGVVRPAVPKRRRDKQGEGRMMTRAAYRKMMRSKEED